MCASRSCTWRRLSITRAESPVARDAGEIPLMLFHMCACIVCKHCTHVAVRRQNWCRRHNMPRCNTQRRWRGPCHWQWLPCEYTNSCILHHIDVRHRQIHDERPCVNNKLSLEKHGLTSLHHLISQSHPETSTYDKVPKDGLESPGHKHVCLLRHVYTSQACADIATLQYLQSPLE